MIESQCKEKTVCLTGHRELGHPKECISNKLLAAICPLIQQGYTHFQVGMANGFDIIAAQVIMELKRKKSIRLIAVLPCPPAEQTRS